LDVTQFEEEEIPKLPFFPKPSVHVGDFVVVQVPITSRSVKGTMYAYYVGSVMSPVDDYKFQVQCMRRHGSLSHADFVFPSADDTSIFSRDDILTILSEPKITRGMHHFSDDFSRWLDIR
jgi:hypothetical protein